MPILNATEIKSLELLTVFVDAEKKFLSPLKDKVILDYLAPALKDLGEAWKSQALVYLPKHPVAKRVLIVNAGSRKDLNAYKLRCLGAHVVGQARGLNLRSGIGVLLPKVNRLSSALVIEEMETGAGLFQFQFEDFKTEKGKAKKAQTPVELSYILESAKEKKGASTHYERARIVAEGVNFGRHLINLSGRQLWPAELARRAREMAKQSPSSKKIKVQVWGEKELEKNKYGGILCVGQGSAHESQLIVMEYKNAAPSQKPSILVGKGITFDSGGLSLKPGPSMETMKYDMGGAASVLAAFKILTDLQVKMNLVCIVPSAENMPSGTAQRPGDIVTMADGQTVEVLNTDAEGRLILADALYHATTQYKPKQVIDVATLTGACAMAVGDAAAGVFANEPKLISQIQKSSEVVQEGVWPLPDFDDFYQPLIKSDFADIRNTGLSRNAGATTAALFLEKFVHNDCSWMHLDIAGCGWYDSPREYIAARGASGVPIRLLVHYLENNHR